MDPLQTPVQTEKTPAEMLQDVKNSFADTAQSVLGDGTVQQVAQTASQVGSKVGQVSDLVVDQVGNLSQKIGGEELVGEVKTMVNPIVTMITEVLKIAFFLKSQSRIGRGQYIVGSLASIVIVGLLVSLFGVIIGPIGV